MDNIETTEDITEGLTKVLSYAFNNQDGGETNRTIYRISFDLYYTVSCDGIEEDEDMQESKEIFSMMNEDMYYGDNYDSAIIEMEFHENPEPVHIINGVSYFKPGTHEGHIAVSEDGKEYNSVSPTMFRSLEMSAFYVSEYHHLIRL